LLLPVCCCCFSDAVAAAIQPCCGPGPGLGAPLGQRTSPTWCCWWPGCG
jgi:hypothetical protein